jgi:hypothetical protein
MTVLTVPKFPWRVLITFAMDMVGRNAVDEVVGDSCT